MNPEFRRNLLLELTLHRLVAMPLILLLVYGAAALVTYSNFVSPIARFVMAILSIAWGSRLAADSVLGEVVGRTWDFQRMSALGPWSMSWGKLLGSTIFVWYGTALSIPALLYGEGAGLVDLARLLMVGLFAQVLALFASLVIQRQRPERLRFHVTQSQIVGLIGAFWLWNLTQWPDYGPAWVNIDWYGFDVGIVEFSLFTGLAFVAWCCLGIYRLMRAELQFRCWPVGWATFTLFCAVYVGGLVPWRIWGESKAAETAVDMLGGEATLRLLSAHIVIVGLTWLAAFAEPKGFVRLRRWFDMARSGSLRDVLRVMPAWAPGLLMALVTGVLIVAIPLLSGAPAYYDPNDFSGVRSSLNFVLDYQTATIGAFAVALFLFLVRDIGIIHFLTLDGRARRALMASLVYLAVLYALLPAVLSVLGLVEAVPALVPSPIGHPAVVILPVLLQVGLVGGLILWRWRKLARAMDGA